MTEEILNAEPEGLRSIALLVGIDENPVLGFFLLYLIVTVLSVIVFKLGFARKIPIFQTIIVYLCLIIGSVILAIFAIGLPIAEGLLISAIVLGIYRFRLHQTRKETKEH